MGKTKIEWCDYTINPVKGMCPMACPYCYARAMYKRFKWNPTIRYDDWVWQEGPKIKPGTKTFVGSTMELFGDWIEPEWMETIFDYCRSCPSHTFIFLTKQPQNLIKWSPFPENCWVGVSITGNYPLHKVDKHLNDVRAFIKFISFEPLLTKLYIPDVERLIHDANIGWAIIGAQTGPYKPPKIEWVKEIVEACDKAGISVFLKNNLHLNVSGKDTWALSPRVGHGELWRQEFPKI